MRKIKVAWLSAMMLVMTLLLSSCGRTANIETVLNPDYDISDKCFTKAEMIPELNGYAVVDQSSSAMVFAIGEGATSTHKVFSFYKGAVVQTISSADANTAYSVQLFSNMPMYCVIKTVSSENEDDKITYTYYDATGAELLSMDAEDVGSDSSPYRIDDEVFLDRTVFTVNRETGAMMKRIDIPEYLTVSNRFLKVNGYYYGDINRTAKLIIYNENFVPIVTWEAPKYNEGDSPRMHVLNNGNVLVQYHYPLEKDAKKFDFLGSVNDEGAFGKYALQSWLITPKGTVKELHLDYLVVNVIRNSDLYDETLEPSENQFTDTFDNIATILPIENKQLDVNILNPKYFLMNNKGKVQKSLNMVEDQAVPYGRKIGDDRYYISTGHGLVIMNGNGKALNTITYPSVNESPGTYFVGDYFVFGDAIYDLDLNKVYDIKENKLEKRGSMGDTVFFKQGEEDSYSIIAWRDGVETTIISYNAENADNSSYGLVGELEGYVIINAAKTEYKYYSADGTLLITTDAELNRVRNQGDKVMMSTGEGDARVYYYFSR